jgi:hypothetical protein
VGWLSRPMALSCSTSFKQLCWVLSSLTCAAEQGAKSAKDLQGYQRQLRRHSSYTVAYGVVNSLHTSPVATAPMNASYILPPLHGHMNEISYLLVAWRLVAG